MSNDEAERRQQTEKNQDAIALLERWKKDAEGKYWMRYHCFNCHLDSGLSIQKGTLAKRDTCPRCGCFTYIPRANG